MGRHVGMRGGQFFLCELRAGCDDLRCRIAMAQDPQQRKRYLRCSTCAGSEDQKPGRKCARLLQPTPDLRVPGRSGSRSSRSNADVDLSQ